MLSAATGGAVIFKRFCWPSEANATSWAFLSESLPDPDDSEPWDDFGVLLEGETEDIVAPIINSFITILPKTTIYVGINFSIKKLS